ncbi:MAG: hypothetical protein NC043_09230 [Muribaculaceae bacterium]|nr:hypothetical protein [Muribaculaceae bacterium]
MDINIDEILAADARRRAESAVSYDPVRGRRLPGRRLTKVPWEPAPVWLPEAMIADPAYARITDAVQYARLRQRYDFEYWTATCVTITDKLTGRRVPLVLNTPQRRILDIIEADRLASRPLRLIMLKARQWGGSTLIQMYFAWIQCLHRRRWNSLICAHVQQTSATIRGMYADMLASYPEEYWTEDEAPKLRAYQGSQNIREIAGRECRITLASSYSQESVRGLDCAMAHLSEVAFWKDTDSMTPEDFIRAVCGGIAMVPLSFVALESTANGVGNFFHSEWLRAKAGLSDKRAVFVPWYEIDIYRLEPPDARAFVADMDEYELSLWERGLTLDRIWWYRCKRREMSSDVAMQAEYPTDDVEAFASTGAGVFARTDVERLRSCCSAPVAVGEVQGLAPVGRRALESVHFVPSDKGELKVWAYPASGAPRSRYVVAVDVGGRSAAADWSVIAVIDRHDPSGMPAIVAQWRGHCYPDILGWRAAAIARWYAGALLVIESNSLESSVEGSARYILEELNGAYPNLYVRTSRDSVTPFTESRLGFHTNRSTKAIVIASMMALVREGAYMERDTAACDEMDVYEQRPNGSFGAKRGHHDDILMTRAIGLYVASSLPVADYTGISHLLNRPRW